MRIWLTLFITNVWYVGQNPSFTYLLKTYGFIGTCEMIPVSHFFAMLIVFAVIYPLVNYFFLMLKAADKWLTERAKNKKNGSPSI